MGNRAFLYLGTDAQIASGDGRSFADANNSFPTLWRLLLADGEPAAPNEFQRVFGNAGTPNLGSRVGPAVARLRRLAEGVRSHPLADTQPHLGLHFDALIAFIDAEVAALGAASHDDLWFSANLDELSWLEDDPPEEFIARERENCNALAADVEAALDAQAFPELDRLLEISSYGATFADWRSWAWNFGFGGLDHPYFAMRDEPRTIPFAEFVPDDETDDDGTDSYLGHGLERFTENGLTGVVRTATVVGLSKKTTERTVIIAPEWDTIASAGHLKRPLFWVTRADRAGLLQADAKGSALLMPCELDEAWGFEQAGSAWLAAVRIGDHLGLISDDGRWIARPESIEPPVTDLWAFAGPFAIAASGDRQGVLTSTGHWALSPTFDSIDDLQASGVCVATSGTTRVLANAQAGAMLTEPLERVEWLAWPGVFEGRRASSGSTGWWRADGRVLIAAEWDVLELLQEKPWRVRVERDGLSGVRDRDDRECVPPVWTTIGPRTEVGYTPVPGHLDEMIVVRDGRAGLLDGKGRELIPPRYDAIANFVSGTHSDDGITYHGATLQVMRDTPDGPKVGAWDLDAGREIIACEYDHLHAITLYRNGPTEVGGYLAVHHAPGDRRGDQDPLRVGILRADGTTLHATQYAWIAERYHVTEFSDAMLVARAIERAWSADEPVQAALSAEDYYVWLRRDGSTLNDLDARKAQFEAGDFTAAHAIACQYRDGDGVPHDETLARRWMLLAAGQPASVFDAPAPGLFKRLLGAKPPSPLVPATPDARGDVQAICDLCQGLINGSQDPEELAAARAWLELAVTRGRDRSRGNAEAHMLLGVMLLEGMGGAPDERRALELSSRAAALGNATASFNVGLMHEYGRGTHVDREAAKRHYTTASKTGDLGADLNLGRMLIAPTSDGTPASKKDVKQGVYHLQRAVDCITPDIAAAAKGELGRLYWTGIGVARDMARAESLLREAAADGDARATEFLQSDVDSRNASP